MPGVAVVGHNRQPLMSLRRGVHRTLGRVKSWVPSLPTLPGRGDRLVIAPQDLRQICFSDGNVEQSELCVGK